MLVACSFRIPPDGEAFGRLAGESDNLAYLGGRTVATVSETVKVLKDLIPLVVHHTLH